MNEEHLKAFLAEYMDLCNKYSLEITVDFAGSLIIEKIERKIEVTFHKEEPYVYSDYYLETKFK